MLVSFSYRQDHTKQETIITYRGTPLIIKAVCQECPADWLALVCLCAFEVPTKSQIMFPLAISARLSQELATAPFYLKVLNVHTQAQAQAQATHKIPAASVGATFSGGYDSLALISLLETTGIRVEYIYQSTTNKALNEQPIIKLGHQLLKSGFKAVETNANSIVRPGWYPWTAVLLPLILLAKDRGWTALALGGNLGSVFLAGGQRFIAADRRPSWWYRIFRAAGLPLICPLAGVSEVGVIKILLASHPEWLDLAIYCQKKSGVNCQRCAKCRRRQLVTDRVVHQRPPRSPLPIPKSAGPSLLWASGYPELNWVQHYYAGGITFQPPEWQTTIQRALDKFLTVMTAKEVAALQQFSST